MQTIFSGWVTQGPNLALSSATNCVGLALSARRFKPAASPWPANTALMVVGAFSLSAASAAATSRIPRSVLSPRLSPLAPFRVQKVMPVGSAPEAAPCASEELFTASSSTPASTAPPARPAVLRNVLRVLFMGPPTVSLSVVAERCPGVMIRADACMRAGTEAARRSIGKNGTERVGKGWRLDVFGRARTGACGCPRRARRSTAGTGGNADRPAFERGSHAGIKVVDIGKGLHMAGVIDASGEIGDVHRYRGAERDLTAASD